MFDVGDLPLLTFGNCVLKTGVIKWPLKLRVRFFNVFKRFFQNPKKTFYVFCEQLHTFTRSLLRSYIHALGCEMLAGRSCTWRLKCSVL